MSLNDSNSPFLSSHKDNPIKWREWGPEALGEAQTSGKPILLALGYLGCLQEPRFFDIWWTRLRHCPRVKNYWYWRVNSYRP